MYLVSSEKCNDLVKKVFEILITIIKLIFIGFISIYLEKTENTNYMFSGEYGKLIFVIAIVLALRGIVRIIYNIEFNSYYDFLISLVSIYTVLNLCINNITINKFLADAFLINTESHVFQLFLFHMYWLINIIIGVLFIISYLVALIMFLVNIAKLFGQNQIKSCKEFIININNKIEETININILQFLNRYINPLYKVKTKQLYKNINMIKVLILILYIISGILIIYYWNDMIIGSANFELVSSFTKEDFENYRILFITPILAVFAGKIIKK